MSSIYDYVQDYLRLTISNLTHFENQFLIHIETIAPVEPAQQEYFYNNLFSGAYIFVHDNGHTYETLTSFDPSHLSNRNHSSSHISEDIQYGYHGSLFGECLFGTKTVDDVKGSWIQLEAYSTDLLELPGHLYSYISYLITGYNQGPYGTSVHTESNPMHLNLQDPSNPTLSNHTIPLMVIEHQENVVSEDENVIQLSDIFKDLPSQPEITKLIDTQIDSKSPINQSADETTQPILEQKVDGQVQLVEIIQHVKQQETPPPVEIID